jgi:hypothetical protein
MLLVAMTCSPGCVLWMFPFVSCSIGVGFFAPWYGCRCRGHAAGFPTTSRNKNFGFFAPKSFCIGFGMNRC